MTYTVYDANSGEIFFTVFGSLPVDQAYVDGQYDSRYYYIDTQTQTVVAKSNKPNDNYFWNYTTKSWELNNTIATRSIRQERNHQLQQIDRVNPIWYASLTTDQQTELQAYRTDLLNVPQQSGFPTNITWPSKPAWL